ncbi:MAG TPA: aspartyl-phosphate phosphatase Spo0E family protein [Ruminiclostridium sp.]
MKNENKKLIHEIQEVREQLYSCIEKNGINDEPCLIEINNRLDELILQWMKSNGK